jgi:serine/threonine protein kinase
MSTVDVSTEWTQEIKKEDKQRYPIFKNQYEIVKSLGNGNTAKVYLARRLDDPTKKIALKILRDEFLRGNDNTNTRLVEQEIQVLSALSHENIVQLIDYGSDGEILKCSGRLLTNLVYITLEYIEGGLLFDLCKSGGAFGEDAGRYLFKQLVASMKYMHKLGVVHRDLKIENILFDGEMGLKVADFGFATYRNI